MDVACAPELRFRDEACDLFDISGALGDVEAKGQSFKGDIKDNATVKRGDKGAGKRHGCGMAFDVAPL
ncbi:hypothetical protein [Castellaniella sp.]|uniref:hypothetical protein n=1 Tax=Castellaniella sp. TaxID=1955812 RepID=UPI002AFF0CFB|nr:hypothetical protein [Castellaniella sp.]